MSQLRNINTTPVVTRGLVGQYDVLYGLSGPVQFSYTTSISNKYPPYLINATSDYLETNPQGNGDSHLAILQYATYSTYGLTSSLINENKGAYIRLPGDSVNRLVLQFQKYNYSGGGYFEAMPQSFFGNTITIQMTLTFEDLTNNKGIYGFHNSGIIAQYASGYIEFGYYPAGSPYAIKVPATTYFGAGRIMNIAHTLTPKPGDNSKHINRLYINGKQYGDDLDINYISIFSTFNSLVFGTSYNATNRFMTGNIYNILLYNTALTPNEVYQNYLIDKFRFGITHMAN